MTIHLIPLLLVAAGGAIGGLARFWLSEFITGRVRSEFPWGTLTVNVTGAFTIGVGGAVFLARDAQVLSNLWLAFAVGALGSYTTVSSFSLQTLSLLHAGRWAKAIGNVALSVGLCLGAVSAGYAVGMALAGR